MKAIAFLVCCSVLPTLSWSQQNRDLHNHPLQDQLEAYLENLEESTDFEFNALSDALLEFLSHPLSLNHATDDDLYALGLLNDIQINELLDYRDRLGTLISLYELQSIPSFDEQTIQRILPFVTILQTGEQITSGLQQMLTSGRHMVLLRWSRILQKQRGYLLQPGSAASYGGGPNQVYVRYRYSYQNKLSYGITLEKDPGERLLSPERTLGVDYVSAHFFAQDISPRIKFIALGDYAVSLGQGLIAHSGFSTGKSTLVTQIKKGGKTIRPYTSLDESAFLRGGAFTLHKKRWTLTVFVSNRRVDGNLRTDTIEATPYSHFSSLQTSGLHRTESELEDRKSVRSTILGTSLGYATPRFEINLNGLYNQFDLPFDRLDRPYNLFRFRGRSLLNTSLDYKYLYKNIHLFGEIAMSQNGGLASIQGLLIGLSRFTDLALLHRSISRDYDALQANAFLESSISSSEQGMYIGSEIRLPGNLRFSLYGDFWSHRWLRFQADAPAVGNEFFMRLTYYKKRALEAYVQFKNERKARNTRDLDAGLNQVFAGTRRSLRFHLSQKITPALELRNRLEFTWAESKPDAISKGFLVFQDVIFRSLTFPASFALRLSYFDTDDFSSRIYAYENDIQYSFSIPAFSDEGFRHYIKIRYDLGQRTVMEVRWDQSTFRTRDLIGSGQDQINGKVRSRLKAQLRFTF